MGIKYLICNFIFFLVQYTENSRWIIRGIGQKKLQFVFRFNRKYSIGVINSWSISTFFVLCKIKILHILLSLSAIVDNLKMNVWSSDDREKNIKTLKTYIFGKQQYFKQITVCLQTYQPRKKVFNINPNFKRTGLSSSILSVRLLHFYLIS